MKRSLVRLVARAALPIWAALIGAVLVAPPSLGYEVNTHRAISNVALRRTDCVVDSCIRAFFILPQGINTGVPGGTLATRLEDGAEHEDDLLTFRSLNHFYDPVHNSGLVDARSGAPSLVWAFDHGDNDFDWHAARGAYYRAFTALTRTERITGIGDLFYDLGHVIHLVQDLGQPQHVRNDKHLTVPFLNIPLPGAPYEDYCRDHYGTPAAIASLTYNGIPPFTSATPAILGVPGSFARYWDTDQYTGQIDFTTFASTPGLAEFTNLYFLTDDTMFGGQQHVYFHRATPPGLMVELAKWDSNHSTEPTQRFPHPRLLDTDLAGLYPGSTTNVRLERRGEKLVGASHSVALTVVDTSGVVVYSMPNLFRVTDDGGIGFDASTYQTYAQDLLPRTVAYSAGLLNHFFRGKLEIHVRWLDALAKYQIQIINRSGETMAGGSWQLYQDDPSGVRLGIPALFNYPGTLPNGASFTAEFVPTNRGGGFALVFQGTLGDEVDRAVIGREFDIVRVHITWTPNSDQDLLMYGPDGSLIWYWDHVTPYGELDNDNVGGLGPENITLDNLQPGRYEFLIDYYRDWWAERYYDTNAHVCRIYPSPVNEPDDTPSPETGPSCFVQTNITVTVLTYHNGDAPVRTQTRTMVYPDYTGGLPAAGNPEGALDDSWYVTQIVTVDAARNVTIGGLGPLMPNRPASAAFRRVPGWNPPRKPEGRRP